MSGFPLALRQALLAHIFRHARLPPPPSTLYVALFLVMPDEETGDGGVEVSPTGTGYQRIATSTGGNGTGIGAEWTEPDDAGVVRNARDLLWPKATGSYGSIAGVGLFDAPTGGRCWGLGALGSDTTIIVNDQFVMDAGQLEFTVS